MGSFTAEILVGSPHPYHGGIIPTHFLFLSENSRPNLILVSEKIFSNKSENVKKIRWIPTVENMLEDALLMISLNVVKNEEMIKLFRKFSQKNEDDNILIYNDLKKEERDELYQRCREIENFPKIVVSVFKGSTIMSQLFVLKKYKMDVEVCPFVYCREYSMWSKEVKEYGNLPGKPN